MNIDKTNTEESSSVYFLKGGFKVTTTVRYIEHFSYGRLTNRFIPKGWKPEITTNLPKADDSALRAWLSLSKYGYGPTPKRLKRYME